jgi:hypothetical protein
MEWDTRFCILTSPSLVIAVAADYRPNFEWQDFLIYLQKNPKFSNVGIGGGRVDLNRWHLVFLSD